jgi:hypothetical protein
LYQSSDEITHILKMSFSEQIETYLTNFRDHIAPLHEEIGELKAELRFLQEKYGIE